MTAAAVTWLELPRGHSGNILTFEPFGHTGEFPRSLSFFVPVFIPPGYLRIFAILLSDPVYLFFCQSTPCVYLPFPDIGWTRRAEAAPLPRSISGTPRHSTTSWSSLGARRPWPRPWAFLGLRAPLGVGGGGIAPRRRAPCCVCLGLRAPLTGGGGVYWCVQPTPVGGEPAHRTLFYTPIIHRTSQPGEGFCPVFPAASFFGCSRMASPTSGGGGGGVVKKGPGRVPGGPRELHLLRPPQGRRLHLRCPGTPRPPMVVNPLTYNPLDP